MDEEVQLVLDLATEQMEKALNHLKSELTKIRAGKANPTMLDGISVDAYGTHMPLSQVSNINTMDARTLTVKPWDKSMLEPISKAIAAANIGINPQNNGEVILLSVPPLTEERRKNLVKMTKTVAEDARIGMRNARKDANEEIKSLQKKGLAEDIAKEAEGKVQKLTDDYNIKIEVLLASKEKDIMTV